MSFRSTIAAALMATATAHMTMDYPVPYSLDKLDNGPITAEQFPCKSNLGFTVTEMNAMKVGEQQTVKFKGSAVHGGGSCQLAVTMDTEPTKDSVFKVISSIEGGCPGVDGGPADFPFTLPDSIPNGKATFAWTWFAKMSGAPEMYMNCAPIEVTGGASDDSAFQQLPDMLVANIGTTTCKSPLNKALKFPNPGSDLQTGGTDDLEAPSGECGATGSSPPAGSAAPSAPAGQPSASAPAGQPSATAPAGQPSATAPAGEPVPSNTGGVLAPSASSAAPVAPVQSTATTLVTVTAAPSVPLGTGVPSVAPPLSTGAPASPPTGGATGTCSENGAIVCNGATQFGICNNGSVVWQAVAAGTTCSNGTIQKRGYNGRIARPRI